MLNSARRHCTSPRRVRRVERSDQRRGNVRLHFRSASFVGGDDEPLSVVAESISNEDRLSVGINRCDAAPTPTGFAEIVSDDFPYFIQSPRSL